MVKLPIDRVQRQKIKKKEVQNYEQITAYRSSSS